MKSIPAKLNRSVRIEDVEIKKYSSRLVRLDQPVKGSSIINKIINQDIFEVIDFLPSNFIDLLFIDPPYNLSKKFNKVSFREMNMFEYIKWFDSWLSKVVRLLKKNASIYICGDWKSSSAIFVTASKYFQVQNRITWEREKGRGAKVTGRIAAKIFGSLQILQIILSTLMK